MNASFISLMRALRVAAVLAASLAALACRAQLTIDITTSGGKQVPIAVMPMAGDNSQPQSVSDVLGADLARTGLFKLVNTSAVTPLPTEPSQVNFGDWTARSAE